MKMKYDYEGRIKSIVCYREFGEFLLLDFLILLQP